MRWEKKDEYYIESDRGYRVSKTPGADGPVYTAWAPRPHPWAEPVSLRYSGALQECIDACEAHLAERGA